MCKPAVKKIPYLVRYIYKVLDQFKTHKMCYKAILRNGGALKSVPDCYKNKKMCKKAFENYRHALEFVPECYKTHNMCGKAVDTYNSKCH